MYRGLSEISNRLGCRVCLTGSFTQSALEHRRVLLQFEIFQIVYQNMQSGIIRFFAGKDIANSKSDFWRHLNGNAPQMWIGDQVLIH